MAANYSCLLIDIDGTLLDFATAERNAVIEAMDKEGLPATEEVAARFSAINTGMWKQLERGEIKKEKLVVRRFSKLLQELNLQGDAVRLNNTFMTSLSSSADAFVGAKELLAELAEFATLAAVSNGSWKAQQVRLEKSGLMPYFDGVFVSEKVGAAKPSPKIFNTALKHLGINNRSRVLMIGDSLTADVQGGNSAGISTCWCNFTQQENTTDIVPTHTAKSFTEVKLIAVGEEELRRAENREKRHMV